MTKRFLMTTVSVLIAFTVIGAEQTDDSVSSAASPVENRSVEFRAASLTTFMVPAATWIQTSASRITYDAESLVTTLEGKASIHFESRDVTGDVILLKRTEGPKGPAVAITAIMK